MGVEHEEALSGERILMISLNLIEVLLAFHYTDDLYYGDLKPRNVLMSNQGKAKFNDFGISYFFQGQSKGYYKGYSPHYCLGDVKKFLEESSTATEPPEPI